MDLKYREDVAKYGKKDAVVAILFYVLCVSAMAVGAIAGRWLGFPMLVSWLGLATGLACIVLVLVRKENLSSIGFGKEKIKSSLLLGFICGLVSIVMLCLVPLINNGEFAPLSNIAYMLVYQLVLIAFADEVIFRGYLQTRLYGIVKSDASAILLGALLFSLMHFLTWIILVGTETFFSISTWPVFLFWFSMHIIYNFVYKRSGVLYGIILFHSLLNTAPSIITNRNHLIFGIEYIYFTIVAIPVLVAIVLFSLEIRMSRSGRCGDK